MTSLEEYTGLIPAAGLGTRMVPATKETPKEMLPVPAIVNRTLVFKPFLQVVFEDLYKSGIRVFVFVVGRGKRIIQDHFIVDWNFHDLLKARGKHVEARALSEFYNMVENSVIIWVDQPSPRGLGDAVLRGLRAVKTENVLVHLGDIEIYTGGLEPVTSDLIELSRRDLECNNIIHTIKVEDPQNYGVIIPEHEWRETGLKLVKKTTTVKGVVEKPASPPSPYAISGVYLFETKKILEALKRLQENSWTGEIELTDAIALLIKKETVCAGLTDPAIFIDIGRPSRYLDTIRILSTIYR